MPTVKNHSVTLLNNRSYDSLTILIASFLIHLKPKVQLWHQRLAHLGCDNVIKLALMVKGIDLTGKLDNPVCEACAAGKMTDMAHTGTISPGT